MIRIRWTAILLLISLVCSGCIVLALSAGAAGGYAISKDEIEDFSDRSLEQVWQAGWDVLNQEGNVEFADKERAKIQAIVDESKVNFYAEKVSPKSVRFTVQARKAMNLFPNMKLAQTLHQKIVKELR